MKVYTYSKARQNLAGVLNEARRKAAVHIKRRDGQEFVITPAKAKGSPLDVPGVRLDLTAAEIVRAVREGREREPAGASIRVPGRDHDAYDLEVALYQRLRRLPARGYGSGKLFARQHVREFSEQLWARMDQEFATFPYRHKQGMRRALPEQSRDDRIRVENAPHAGIQRTERPRSAR